MREDGAIRAGHDFMPELQEGQPAEGRRARPVSFQLRPEPACAQVLERTEVGDQDSELRLRNPRLDARARDGGAAREPARRGEIRDGKFISEWNLIVPRDLAE